MPSALNHLDPATISIDPADLTPLGDRVLIRHLPLEEKAGSIVIPPVSREKMTYTKNHGYTFRGVVVSIGPGETYRDRVMGEKVKYFSLPSLRPITPELHVGDEVLFERRQESEFYCDGERYSLVHAEQSVLAVVTGE